MDDTELYILNWHTDSKAKFTLCKLTKTELWDVICTCTNYLESKLLPFQTKYRSCLFPTYTAAEDNQHVGILWVVRDLRQGVERQVLIGEALSKVIGDKNATLEVSRHFRCQDHLRARVQQVRHCEASIITSEILLMSTWRKSEARARWGYGLLCLSYRGWSRCQTLIWWRCCWWGWLHPQTTSRSSHWQKNSFPSN